MFYELARLTSFAAAESVFSLNHTRNPLFILFFFFFSFACCWLCLITSSPVVSLLFHLYTRPACIPSGLKQWSSPRGPPTYITYITSTPLPLYRHLSFSCLCLSFFVTAVFYLIINKDDKNPPRLARWVGSYEKRMVAVCKYSTQLACFPFSFSSFFFFHLLIIAGFDWHYIG